MTQDTANSNTGDIQYSIIVADRLDFESTTYGTYKLVLTAVDIEAPLFSVDYDLEISVIDENEMPWFPQTAYEASVTEGVPIGTIVTQLSAFDPDVGGFAELTSSISSTNSLGLLFVIEGTSGTVYTTDYEAFPMRFIVFEITATDNYQVNHIATTILTVHICDQNDNVPYFTTSTLSISVPEDTHC